jgi:NitT/TauT family transport system ATP-binding protein
MRVICRGVGVDFNSTSGSVCALKHVDLDVPRGQFLSVVGPSGCGKTTLLRAIAGLVNPTSGSITGSTAGVRPLLVYQENSLFPWMTVLENACFGLEAQGLPKAEREERAIPLLWRFGLAGRENAWPHQLSVGMKQRVAVIRSFVSGPDLLLMDEPFASVDAHMRMRLQQELLSLWEQSSTTVVFVTHDVNEALLLGDRVIVLSAAPGTVVASMDVPLPRPRDLEITWSSEFQDLKREIFVHLGMEAAGRPVNLHAR